MWDLKTGEEIHRIGPFPGFVTGVLFAPDGKSFFVASGTTGFNSKKKTAVLLHCSITQIDAVTGQAMQFWDRFPNMPAQMLRSLSDRQLIVVAGNTLVRMSTENGKTISPR